MLLTPPARLHLASSPDLSPLQAQQTQTVTRSLSANKSAVGDGLAASNAPAAAALGNCLEADVRPLPALHPRQVGLNQGSTDQQATPGPINRTWRLACDVDGLTKRAVASKCKLVEANACAAHTKQQCNTLTTKLANIAFVLSHTPCGSTSNACPSHGCQDPIELNSHKQALQAYDQLMNEHPSTRPCRCPVADYN